MCVLACLHLRVNAFVLLLRRLAGSALRVRALTHSHSCFVSRCIDSSDVHPAHTGALLSRGQQHAGGPAGAGDDHPRLHAEPGRDAGSRDCSLAMLECVSTAPMFLNTAYAAWP